MAPPVHSHARALAWVAGLGLGLAACGPGPRPPVQTVTDRTASSLLARLGGLDQLQRWVDEGAAIGAADPRLAGALATVDFRAAKRGALAYLCRLAGGDCRYQGPRLAAIGRAVALDHDGFAALVEDLRRASLALALPPTPAGELLDRIAALEPELLAR